MEKKVKCKDWEDVVSEKCIYEERWGMVLTKMENWDKFLNNDFHELKQDVKSITDKLNHKRPSWSVSTILIILSSLCVGLIVAMLK